MVFVFYLYYILQDPNWTLEDMPPVIHLISIHIKQGREYVRENTLIIRLPSLALLKLK